VGPLRAVLALAIPLTICTALPAAASEQLLYGPENNRLRRIDPDTIGNPKLLHEIHIEQAGPGEPGGPGSTAGGRDQNGTVCALPDGSGRYLLGEDTSQPTPPPGWGVFDSDRNQVGKLTATYLWPSAAAPQGEPFGCAFNSQGILFTTEVGNQDFTGAKGQLIMWFPPYDVFPGPPGDYPNTNAASTNFCKIDIAISSASGITIDANDNVYVASSAGFTVYKYVAPFPTGPDAAGGCGRLDETGAPLADADRVNRSSFIPATGFNSYSGLARSGRGTLYVGNVLTGQISEWSLKTGAMVRDIVAPGLGTGNVNGLAVAEDGTLYYADLDLDPMTFEPGNNGKVWQVRFDSKWNPQPPLPVLTGLRFPDGLGFLPGDLQVDPGREWPSYAGGPNRLFYSPQESILTPDNVSLLRERWRFPTGAVVTSSPAVALVDLPGEGPTQVVYFQSWGASGSGGVVYAVRLSDGSQVWSFQTALQPGASFPGAASPHVEDVNGSPRVFIASGETMYSLDAATGAEVWRFTAGTGCGAFGGANPCAFWDGSANSVAEQNQIESSGVVADGKLFFGMDVDDDEVGKGGFYAVDAADGRLAWFFDLESGMTCRPDMGEDIRRFDGYHSEAELGLPAGFRSRMGCDFPASRNGCGSVWSSAAIDTSRQSLYVASSNCDTDSDPNTRRPDPPMPPYDEAIFALGFDGTPRWRWRPREVDNDDLAFGAVPNLFSIQVGASLVDVVGVGGKDGTYTVIDRDGVNEVNLVSWNDMDPSMLPYWRTQVVTGGAVGGVIATAAADQDRRRIFFSTAPGSFSDIFNPQVPTIHALDMDTGAVVWDSGVAAGQNASFSPTSAVPGLMMTGTLLSSELRFFETQGDAGTERHRTERLVVPGLGFGDQVASGAVVINGTVLVGTGSGQRGPIPSDPGNLVSNIPSPLVALCVPGQPGCPIPDRDKDGIPDDSDNCMDAPNTDQTDAGSDGFGNACDPDYDDSGRVGGADFSRLRDAYLLTSADPGFDPALDYDSDGVIDAFDLKFLRQNFGRAPGPSAVAP